MAQQYPESVFDILDAEFRRLIDNGFHIDCREISSDLPQQLNPLELKARVLHPSTSYELRDAVWRYLVEQARRDQAWMVVAVGMLQPGMRIAAGRLVRRFNADAEDLDSEFLAGVIEAIATVDLDRSGIAGRLINAGVDRVRRWFVADGDGDDPTDLEAEVLFEPGHPELALWRAVKEKVISAQDAELIASTRLGQDTLKALAVQFGMTTDTLLHRRYRAEERLKQWIEKKW